MAVFRKVHTEFWTDPKVLEEMTPEDKYFMLYLLTNPNTTQIGIYQISKKTIAFELGYSMESVKALMDRFIKNHKIIKYNDETRELAIRNWGKYNLNRAGKPMEDCVKAELKKVKDINLIGYVGELVKSPNLKALYDTYTIRGQEEEKEEEEEEEEDKEVTKISEKFNSGDIEYELSKYLFEQILKNDNKAKKPNFHKWAENIDKLKRLDKRSTDQIKEVIDFAVNDDFWKCNILSTSSLRKQFPRLYLQCNGKKPIKGHKKDFEEREYDYDELERKLLGWE